MPDKPYIIACITCATVQQRKIKLVPTDTPAEHRKCMICGWRRETKEYRKEGGSK